MPTILDKQSDSQIHEIMLDLENDALLENNHKPSLFNLIVYTNQEEFRSPFKTMIKLITEQFPCRIIFIKVNEKENIDLRLTSHFETNDEKNFSCDQVLIQVSKKDIELVSFLVTPLFIPDLPLYLLWEEDPSKKNVVLTQLEKFAKRLIFDSEATKDLQKFAANLIQRNQSLKTEAIDLNWAKIWGWREVLSQNFDCEERFNQLATATHLKILYNIPQDSSSQPIQPKIQAIYFQAWLATCLGWKMSKQENQGNMTRLYYSSTAGTHQIDLIPDNNPQFSPEEMLEIEICGLDNYICNLKRKDEQQVEVHAANQSQCELPFTLSMPTLNSGRNYLQEIFYQKMSPQYIRTLELISSIQWS